MAQGVLFCPQAYRTPPVRGQDRVHLTYAANLGRDTFIATLHDLAATDLRSAIDRATLQSRIGTARMLHALPGAPRPPAPWAARRTLQRTFAHEEIYPPDLGCHDDVLATQGIFVSEPALRLIAHRGGRE